MKIPEINTSYLNSNRQVSTFENKKTYTIQKNITYVPNFGSLQSSNNSSIQKFYKSAINYVKKFLPKKEIDLSQKEGLQQGLRSIEHLTMKEIKFFASKLSAIPIKRGCSNMCIHCYAEAMPQSHQAIRGNITSFNFEDFKTICDDFQELNKRLNFNIFGSRKKTLTLFHDSDASSIYLIDKNGKHHDYLDLAQMIHKTTGRTLLFDTAGWNPKDQKTQKRMEELVNKYTNSEDYDFMKFYVSVNPFHSIYNKYVEASKNKDIEKMGKFRELYINRMANTLFTLTPIFKKSPDQADFIVRYLNDNMAKAQGFKHDDLVSLYETITRRLTGLYMKDFSTSKRVIKNSEEIVNNPLLTRLKFRLTTTNEDLNNIGITGRLTKIVRPEEDKFYEYTQINFNNNPIIAKQYSQGIIDVNGDYYLSNCYETYPTEISLNLTTKGKQTYPIKPNLNSQTITKEIINSK